MAVERCWAMETLWRWAAERASGVGLLKEPVVLGAMGTHLLLGTPQYPVIMARQVPSKGDHWMSEWLLRCSI